MNDPDTTTTAPAKEQPSGEALIAAYRNKLTAAYTAGATLDELSAQYGLSPSAIRARLKAWGVTFRQGGRRNTAARP